MRRLTRFFWPQAPNLEQEIKSNSFLEDSWQQVEVYNAEFGTLEIRYRAWLTWRNRVGIICVIWLFLVLVGATVIFSDKAWYLSIAAQLTGFILAILTMLPLISLALRYRNKAMRVILVMCTIKTLKELDMSRLDITLDEKRLLKVIDEYALQTQLAAEAWLSAHEPQKYQDRYRARWRQLSRQIWEYKENARSATSATLSDLRQEFTKHLLAYFSGQLGDILPDIHDEEITLRQSRWKIAIIVIPLILGVILMAGLMTMMFIAVGSYGI